MARNCKVMGVALLGFISVWTLSGCYERGGAGPVPTTPTKVKAADAPGDDVAALATANNQFAAAVYGRLRTKPGNIVFSPYSLHAAISLSSAGAGGPTLDEMSAALNHTLTNDALHRASATMLDSLTGDNAKAASPLLVANALWVEKSYSIKQTFRTLAIDHYLAPVTNVDFMNNRNAAADLINRWISEHTGGMIPTSLDADTLHPLTRLIITNTALFKGAWKVNFNEEATHSAPFNLAPPDFITGSERIMVPTMRREGFFGYAQTKDLTLLKMLFKDERFSMVIVLPRVAQELQAMETAVGLDKINELAAQANFRLVEVVLPKFDFRLATPMKPVLIGLGMRLAFDENLADFVKITEPANENLYLIEVFHNAAIIVDESGAKAAAVTRNTYGEKDGAPPLEVTPRFIADQPFLFLIRHEATGAILFAGRVSDPRGQPEGAP